MKCPFCAHPKDKVVDSRESGAGDAIRRRRECLECGRRFTSYERIERVPVMVVKKDGQREAFDRGKLLAGLHRACEKRPVPTKDVHAVVDEIEQWVQEDPDREVEASAIGERTHELEVPLSDRIEDQIVGLLLETNPRDMCDLSPLGFVEIL